MVFNRDRPTHLGGRIHAGVPSLAPGLGCMAGEVRLVHVMLIQRCKPGTSIERISISLRDHVGNPDDLF